MPIYEYACFSCARTFSLLQKIGTSEKETKCPDCGSQNVKKRMSSFSCPHSESSGLTPSFSPAPGGT